MKVGEYCYYDEIIVQIVAEDKKGHFEVKDKDGRSYIADELDLYY